MIKINERISVDGFDSREEFNQWLRQQERNEPNSNVLKTFKYFLIQLEEDTKNNIYDKQHCDAVDKYAAKVIQRKLMSEENVIKYIREAQNI